MTGFGDRGSNGHLGFAIVTGAQPTHARTVTVDEPLFYARPRPMIVETVFSASARSRLDAAGLQHIAPPTVG